MSLSAPEAALTRSEPAAADVALLETRLVGIQSLS